MVDFEENIKLVPYVLSQMNISSSDPYYEDMVQEGRLGLLAACERYDPTKKSSFSTYAYWYIKGYILKWYREFKNKPIKISRGVYDTAIHYRKSGSYEETAKALKMTVERVIECVTAYEIVNSLDSLNRVVSGSEGQTEIQDLYVDSMASVDPLSELQLEDILKGFTEKQREIIQYKMQGFNQSEIAELINVSQSYVSRVYGEAVKKLAAKYDNTGLLKGGK